MRGGACFSGDDARSQPIAQAGFVRVRGSGVRVSARVAAVPRHARGRRSSAFCGRSTRGLLEPERP